MTYPDVRHVVNGASQTSDSATYRRELPRAGALHSLLLKFAMTNGSTDGHGVSMFDVVDDIRVIANGHQTLYQLTPEEIEKWHETLLGKPLEIDQDEQASAVQHFVLPVMFGRKLYDPEMWLPLGSFERVELEVDYTPNIAAAAGFATGTFTVDVVEVVTPPDRSPVYRGTLVTRRVKTFTSAASGVEETELHRGFPIRAIGLYAYETAIEDGVDITNVNLNAENGSLDLFTADWLEFLALNRELFGAKIEHKMIGFGQNNDTFATRLTAIQFAHVLARVAVDTTGDVAIRDIADAIAGDRLTIDSGSIDITAGSETITAYATDHIIDIKVEGLSPSYFGVIPFMYQDGPEGYLDTNQFSKLQVDLTQGAAGATVYVATQELRQF